MSRRGPSLAAQVVRLGTATAADPDGSNAGQVRPRRTIPVELDAIRCRDRVRSRPDAVKVAELAASMDELGQQAPVLVRYARDPDPRRPDTWGPERTGLFDLVAGAHRIAAARHLGWTRIEAVLVDGSPDEIRLMELDENLARAELTALDRARFLAAREGIRRRRGGRSHGGDRRSAAFRDQAEKIAAWSGASDAGPSERTVRRAVRIAEDLDPKVAEAIRGTPIADREGDLHRLAGLLPGEQTAVLRAWEAEDPRPARLAGAFAAALLAPGIHYPNGRPARGSRIAMRALKEAWEAADPDVRRRFLAWAGKERSDVR